MLTILINAYAVCPGRGSEPGMGWNWCSNLARHCELHVITESEFRNELERELRLALESGHGRFISREQACRMHFHFNTIGGSEERAAKIRRMCWNQGDWRFYWYYSLWQRETLRMARAIASEHSIVIIHQLNMVGFREPGFLWKIDGIPFVWGPIGGLGSFPMRFVGGATWQQKLKFRLKNIISLAQLKWMPSVCNTCKRADLLISANPSSVASLKRYKNVDSVLIPETGCMQPSVPPSTSTHDFAAHGLRLLWVGRFIFSKRLDIALDVMVRLNDLDIQLDIYGCGSDAENAHYRQMAIDKGVDGKVCWMGMASNEAILRVMRESDLLLFTSVYEATSTVVLEAIQSGLPVICFDTCGMSYVVDNSIGIKIPLTEPKQSAHDFAAAIRKLYGERTELRRMSDNTLAKAQELSWNRKMEQVVGLYEKIMSGK